MMDVSITGMLVLLMLCNLPPNGPAPEAGSYWLYGSGDDHIRMECRAVTRSPRGETVELAMIEEHEEDDPDYFELLLDVRLLPRQSRIEWLRLWLDGREVDVRGQVTSAELRAGEEWEIPELATFPVSSLRSGEEVSVPAGRFADCTRVEIARQGRPKAAFWIAPGVGLARVDVGGSASLELLRYDVGGEHAPIGTWARVALLLAAMAAAWILFGRQLVRRHH